MMERLTKKFTDGGAYCEDIEDVGIQGINAPTFIGKSINKLAEYEDAEEAGLLLRLPCKAKSIVYLLEHSFLQRKNKPFKCEVDEFIFSDNGCYAVLNGAENFYAMRRFKATKIDNFGVTVFLTEEEAEAALQAMEQKEGGE